MRAGSVGPRAQGHEEHEPNPASATDGWSHRPVGAAGSPRARPDARPSRLVVGAGALAALSVMGAGLVRYPVSDVVTAGETATARTTRPSHVKVERRVRYVRLRRGQQALRREPGLDAGGCPGSSMIVVRHIAAPAAAVTVRRPTVRTRQSGGR